MDEEANSLFWLTRFVGQLRDRELHDGAADGRQILARSRIARPTTPADVAPITMPALLNI
jgi:hypothetical protein